MTNRQLPRGPSSSRCCSPSRSVERHRAAPGGRADHRRPAHGRRARTPPSVFDYTDGAAEAEISLRRARHLFRRAGVPAVDPARRVPRRPDHGMIGNAARAAVRVRADRVHADDEPRGRARGGPGGRSAAASRTRCPRWAPPRSRTSRRPAPDARKWFQLYVWKDRSAGEDLMARAKAAGYEALMLTVDVPVAGARLRDARNGFSIPPALTVEDRRGRRDRTRRGG